VPTGSQGLTLDRRASVPDGLDRRNPIQTIHTRMRRRAGSSLFHAVGTDHTFSTCES
jgi:hypothetical protein